MNAQIDRLMWIDKADFRGNWQVDLEITYEDDYGKKVEYCLWDEKDGKVGLPKSYWHFAVPQQDWVFRLTDPVRDDRVAAWPTFQIHLYPEQQKACDKILAALQTQYVGGVLHAKTGTGKTIMALAIAAALGRKTLILVHKKDLMEQWLDRYEQCFGNRDVGFVWQNKCDTSHNCTLGMIQTFHSRMNDLTLWNEFDLVIGDEIHHVPAQTYVAVTRKFQSRYMLGLTATPKRADGLERIFFWHIGPIIARCEQENETGRFFQKKMWCPVLQAKAGWIRDNLARVINLLVEVPARNEWLLNQIDRAIQKKRRVLVLSDRVRHCERLAKELRQKYDGQIGLYLGKMTKNQLVESAKKQCIIATYGMVMEATDIPELDTLFLATPRGNIEQAVGRVQRVCEGKQELMVVDIVDLGLPAGEKGKFLEAMGWKRYHMLKRLGFEEIE